MATIKIIQDKKPNENGECQVFLQYVHNQKRIVVSTGCKVAPLYFDITNQQHPIKKTLKGYTTKEAFINSTKEKVNEVLKKLIVQGIEPEVSVVRDALREGLKTKQKDFWSIYNDFIINAEGNVAHGTLKQYKSVQKNFKDFCIDTKFDPEFSKMTLSIYDKYTYYLRHEKKLENNSIGNNVKFIKSFLNHCIERNIEVPDLKKWKVFKETKQAIYLTQDELEQLKNHDFKNARLERVRDLFILACRTGLRISDLFNLKKHHVQDGWIIMKAKKKQQKGINIFLLEDAQEILDKYEYKLPKISEQRYRDYIKEACELAKIESKVEINGVDFFKYQVVSSHTAVKTFVTHCMENGVSDINVAEMLGKSIKVIKQYYSGHNKLTMMAEMKEGFKRKLVI